MKVCFQLCLRDEVPAHGEQAAVAVSPGVAAEEPVRLLTLTLALQAAGIYLTAGDGDHIYLISTS